MFSWRGLFVVVKQVIMRQSGACVSSTFPSLSIVSRPLHPRQQLTAVMISPNHLVNPSTPSPLPGACVPATVGTHAELLVCTSLVFETTPPRGWVMWKTRTLTKEEMWLGIGVLVYIGLGRAFALFKKWVNFLGRTAAIRRVIGGRQGEITTSHFCYRDTCAIAGWVPSNRG